MIFFQTGKSLVAIQKLLGHTNLDTTLGYIHNDYQTLYDDYSKLWKSDSSQISKPI